VYPGEARVNLGFCDKASPGLRTVQASSGESGPSTFAFVQVSSNFVRATEYLHRDRDEIFKWCTVSVSVLSTGGTVHCNFVCDGIVTGGGRALPTLTSLGKFFHHDGMYARRLPFPLYSVVQAGRDPATTWCLVEFRNKRSAPSW
jgi:hypothetical protein